MLGLVASLSLHHAAWLHHILSRPSALNQSRLPIHWDYPILWFSWTNAEGTILPTRGYFLSYWYSFTPHDPRVGNMFVTVLVPSCYPCRASQATKLHDEALPRLRERFQKLGYVRRSLSPPVTVTTWRTGQWSMCKFSSHGEELAAWKCLKYMAPHQKYVIFLRGCSLVAVSDVFFFRHHGWSGIFSPCHAQFRGLLRWRNARHGVGLDPGTGMRKKSWLRVPATDFP